MDFPEFYYISQFLSANPLLSNFWAINLIQFQYITTQLVIAVIGLAILLIGSAIFSASEVAFFSFSPENYDFLNSNKSPKNNKLLALLNKPQRLLATLLIGNNFAKLGCIILSTYIINQIIDFKQLTPFVIFIQVVLTSFGLLVFGEILPKVFASQASLRFASRNVRFIARFCHFLWPISSIVVYFSTLVNRNKQRQQHLSIDDLSDALDLAAASLSEDKQILKSIVKFGNTEAREIMKPRMDVVAIDIRKPYSRVLVKIVDYGYSRIPVYDTTFDHIKGVLYIKDLLPHLEKDNRFRWQSLIRPPYFVPGTKKINDLLEEFQLKKIHMAIVVDEYGGTNGIVTMEDILEEIIGEINDEYDSPEESSFKKIDDLTYIFEAKILLNDFYKSLHLPNDIFDDLTGDADTLAGIILEIKGEIPQKNDIIVYKNFEFRIEAVDFRRIQKIMVKLQKPIEQNAEN
jgi:putative hemolysin